MAAEKQQLFQDRPVCTPGQSDIAIRVSNLSKCYQIYEKPQDRLKQAILPRLYRAAAPLRKVLRGVSSNSPTYYRDFWALKDVSFEVKKGETVGIIGRNGSGKSTLLQMIAGTLTPTSGNVEVNGRIAALLELGSGFNADFTGRENVYLNASILGLSNEEIDARFDDIAAFADIGEFIDQPVKTYSSGMVVRLAFAVSVNVDADILIVDEALAVGDAAFQFKCLDRLKRLTQSGSTLLFVSHDMGMVKNFCHHTLYLYGGKERARGNPEEIAELYFLDMRDEQRRWQAAAGTGVVRKTYLGDGQGIAFGTEQGRIVRAEIGGEGSLFSTFLSGEQVPITIDVEYQASLAEPSLSLLIQERRLLDIGGGFFPLCPIDSNNGWCRARLSVEFNARLQTGRYFVTVRLESRKSGSQFFPIDKQVGVLSFEILPTGKTFLGAVDLEMHPVKGIKERGDVHVFTNKTH